MAYEDPGTAWTSVAGALTELARAIEHYAQVQQRMIDMDLLRHHRLQQVGPVGPKQDRLSQLTAAFMRGNARNMEDYQGPNPVLKPFASEDTP